MNSARGLAAVLLLGTALTPLCAHAQGAPASADAPVTVGEVVVSAQRREERLKDVPISITALTSADLGGAAITSTADLSQVTPGLQFATAGAYAQPTIRGIGTSVTSAGSDANVAIYVDGVYLPNQNANFFEFSDVQQIDVLKGPQGTLYGRNATGGAINITTLTPSFEPHAKMSFSYGSYNERTASGYFTAPIVQDKLAVGVSLYTNRDDGYSEDVRRHADMSYSNAVGGRVKFLFTPTDRLSFTLSADTMTTQDLRGYSLKVLNGNVATPNAFVPSDARDLALSFTPVDFVQSGGASLTSKYDAGPVKVSAITAWRSTNVSILTDLDRNADANSYSSFGVKQRTLTQEVNVASNTPGRLQWVAGVYYYNDRATSEHLVTNGTESLRSSVIRSEAEAVYGQVDYSVTDKLTLTGGLRYSNEQRTVDAARPVGFATQQPSISGRQTWAAFTPRVAARYAINDASNVYASWSEGFKSGTYNALAFSTLPVNPEKVDAYEVGYKYARGAATITLAGFYYDYKDIQVQAVSPGNGLTILTNAARAKIWGGEAAVQYRFTPNLRVDAGLAYTHSKYESFRDALVTIPKVTAADCGTNPNRPCGNFQQQGDASDNDMIRSPEVTANLGATYNRDVAGGDFELNANVYYNSGFFWDPANRLEQSSYTLLNATASWSPDGAPWRVSIWGKNLTDETYTYYVTDTTAGDAVAYAAPRQVGVRIDFNF